MTSVGYWRLAEKGEFPAAGGMSCLSGRVAGRESTADGHGVDGHGVDGYGVDGYGVTGYGITGHGVDGVTGYGVYGGYGIGGRSPPS
jgi:hypothetical protein